MTTKGTIYPKRIPLDLYLSQCVGKIGHTKHGAKREAKRMSWEYHRVFKAYYCIFCDKWHVGRSRKLFTNRYNRSRRYRDSL